MHAIKAFRNNWKVMQSITHFFLLLFLLTSCSIGAPTATTTLPASPTENVGGLSSESAATLRSLEKLDDYPFYAMHYAGEYRYPQIGSTWSVGVDFSCSLFATLAAGSDMVYGRNFDWDMSPTLLLFTDPPDGYASASMVDLEFIGISPEASKNLADLPLLERIALLSAPSMPFDGMNEYGLTVGMAAVPGDYKEHASYDPSKPTIGSIGIIRQILDHARNVDEAVELFKQYNIDFRGGPLIHYLIADPAGKAVLIEFYLGEMKVLPNEAPWHLATNHFRCTAEGNGGCPRYRKISEQLIAMNGQLDPKSAMQLLSEVRQGITQWSAVYDMISGDINVAIAGNYDSIYNFHLDLAQP
jgi:hypothetical protein